jgi:hypothetical protein
MGKLGDSVKILLNMDSLLNENYVVEEEESAA